MDLSRLLPTMAVLTACRHLPGVLGFQIGAAALDACLVIHIRPGRHAQRAVGTHVHMAFVMPFILHLRST